MCVCVCGEQLKNKLFQREEFNMNERLNIHG